MQKEIILTEEVWLSFKKEPKHYTFPAIQKYLDEGYVVKNIFYSPQIVENEVSGIVLTVHLQWQSPERQ